MSLWEWASESPILEIPPSVSVHFLFHEQGIDERAEDKGREREREVKKACQGQGIRKGRGALQSSGKQHYLAHALAVYPQVRLPAVAALTRRGVKQLEHWTTALWLPLPHSCSRGSYHQPSPSSAYGCTLPAIILRSCWHALAFLLMPASALAKVLGS